MNIEKVPLARTNAIEAILNKHYMYLVVDPYAVNLIDKGKRKGQARLSFYSAFIVNAADELYKAGVVDKIVLFSDASFGNRKASTGKLMKDALTKRGKGLPDISEVDIIYFSDPKLNNTAAQVRALSKTFRKQDSILYLTWNYHKERVQNHLEGYGLNNTTALRADDVHKHFMPSFDKEKLDSLLPHEEIEEMESGRRKLSKVDKKGRIPLAVRMFRNDAFTLDNVRLSDGKLHFMYKPGSKRLREVASQ